MPSRAIAQRIVIDEIDGKKKESSPLWLADAIEICLKDRWPDPQPNDSGYSDARKRLGWFVDFVGKINLKEVTEDDMTSHVQRYVDQRKKKLAARTVINDCLVISRLFTWLMQRCKEHGISWRVCPASRDLLDVPRAENPVKQPVSDDVLNQFLVIARGTEIWPSVVLVLGCGIRPKAAARVRWSDIDFEARIITIEAEKRKNIARPISDWAMIELRELMETRTSETVATIHADTVAHRVKKLRDSANLSGVTLQTLRKTFVNRLYRGGVPPQIAAKMAGHTVQTAQRYYVDFTTMDATEALKYLDFGRKTSSKTSAKEELKESKVSRKSIQ